MGQTLSILTTSGTAAASGFSGSPFRAVLKLRIPSPSPLATSGIFFPPNSSTATPRITSSSGKPIVSIRVRHSHQTLSLYPALPAKVAVQSEVNAVPSAGELGEVSRFRRDSGGTADSRDSGFPAHRRKRETSPNSP